MSILAEQLVGPQSSTYVALAADHLLAVVLGGQGLQGRLNEATTETEDQVEGGLLSYSSVFCYICPLSFRAIELLRKASSCEARSLIAASCSLTFWML